MLGLQKLFDGRSVATPVSTRSLCSQCYDFVDLVQPVNYLVTAFLAQNGFGIRPIVPLQVFI